MSVTFAVLASWVVRPGSTRAERERIADKSKAKADFFEIDTLNPDNVVSYREESLAWRLMPLFRFMPERLIKVPTIVQL